MSGALGGALTHAVLLDEKEIYKLKSGGHIEFTLKAGPHTIGVRCFGGWTPAYKEQSLRFLATLDREYFFEISPNKTCAGIKAIEAEEAKDLVHPNVVKKLWYRLTNQ